jgi:hypothetical protein
LKHLLNITCNIRYLVSLQEYVAFVVIFDGDNTYAEETYYDKDPEYLWLCANNLWVKVTFAILEAQAPQYWRKGDERLPQWVQLSLFTEPE